MAWTLGDITLPDPAGFSRKYIEKSIYHECINGTSRKDITSRKQQFVLKYVRLTQVQAAEILGEFNDKSTANFAVTDGDMSIASTEVHIDVDKRNYNTKGSEFREDITLTLTEVS